MLPSLERAVERAEERQIRWRRRASEGIPHKTSSQLAGGTPLPAPHRALAMDAALATQNNHLELQLQASEHRALLLERRLQERQVIVPTACIESILM